MYNHESETTMKVLTFGVFDYFHYGHLRLLERAAELGDTLVVAVQRTEEIQKNKPDTDVMFPLEQRMAIIGALRVVDEVVPYSQVADDISQIEFDILAVGGDQNHEGFMTAISWAKEHGKQVVVLSRTPNICSTQIKKNLETK